jgi:vitamin B12 transporter
LQEVIIIPTKQETFTSSKKQVKIDIATLDNYKTTTIAELLANQSTIHIKTYGAGNIATTSIRGGSSSQTAILWNGLNIQNAMLGQTDLSLMPSLFFNSVNIEYGGGSALWGSGAIGGSIHLQNNLNFNQGINATISSSIGSFGTQKIASAVLLSYKKIIFQTKIYVNKSENNYQYTDTLDKENPNKKVTHSNYITQDLSQEISYAVSQNQNINLRMWINSMNRNIPSYGEVNSNQNQIDNNFKINTDWNFNKQRFKSIIRFGFFNDQLNYTDNNASIYSKSNTKTLISESDNYYTLKHQTFNFGINYTGYYIKTSNYIENNALNKFALFAAYKLSLINHKLNYNVALRKENANQTNIPITGNTGIHYQLTKLFATKINVNKSYRQPTLNDLYWNPGGNRLLKPEDSYEIDGGLEFSYKKNNFNINIEGSYFNRHTTNWIVWLPTKNNYWSPINIAQVYSRGTESKTEFSFRKNNLDLHITLNTAYVLSTNQKNVNENDNSINKQLTYTPRYTAQSAFLIKYKNTQISLNNTYTGYRFTSTDNSKWLNPYNVLNFKLSYNLKFKNFSSELFTNVNNVLNKNYMIILNRPMPLRNYEIGITINFYKKKSKQ